MGISRQRSIRPFCKFGTERHQSPEIGAESPETVPRFVRQTFQPLYRGYEHEGAATIPVRFTPSGPLQDRIGSQAGLTDMDLHVAFPVLPSLAREIEEQAHHDLRSKRLRGEWFRVTADEAVAACERAILSITRKRASGPQNGRPRVPIDASSPEGQKILADRRQALFD